MLRSWFRSWFRSRPWRETTIWALDLETSGLDPAADVILSVGMVPIREGTVRWGERYYSLVRTPDGHRPSPEAMKIHHILPEEADRAPELPDVIGPVIDRLREGPILLHYAKLDLGFLREACRRRRVRWPAPTVLDTVRMLSKLTFLRRRLDPYAESMPSDLARAREELGLPPHLHHHALYDALATAELFLALAERLGARTLRQVG